MSELKPKKGKEKEKKRKEENYFIKQV